MQHFVSRMWLCLWLYSVGCRVEHVDSELISTAVTCSLISVFIGQTEALFVWDWRDMTLRKEEISTVHLSWHKLCKTVCNGHQKICMHDKTARFLSSSAKFVNSVVATISSMTFWPQTHPQDIDPNTGQRLAAGTDFTPVQREGT